MEDQRSKIQKKRFIAKKQLETLRNRYIESFESSMKKRIDKLDDYLVCSDFLKVIKNQSSNSDNKLKFEESKENKLKNYIPKLNLPEKDDIKDVISSNEEEDQKVIKTSIEKDFLKLKDETKNSIVSKKSSSSGHLEFSKSSIEAISLQNTSRPADVSDLEKVEIKECVLILNDKTIILDSSLKFFSNKKIDKREEMFLEEIRVLIGKYKQ